jgi:Neuraminidase (sialidase)
LLTGVTTHDEVFPRFFPGPKGEVFRLSQLQGDAQAGGGAVLLALAKPQDAWEKLLEVRPLAKGVTARDANLAIGPSGELAVVYRWWRHYPRSKQLRVAQSGDGGKTWSRPSTQVDTSGKAFSPGIAWSDKSLVVVWADERRHDQIFDIYARRSPDGGQTWEPEQVLSRFPQQLPSDLYARPLLVSDGQDRLWAVWVAFRSMQSAVYLSRSTDGGRHWADPVALTGDSRSVFGHILLRAGDRMLLVWHDTRTNHDRVYAVSSSDNGATWTAPVRVDHLPADSSANASSPTAVLTPEGEALVAWQDGRNGRADIFLARSTDGGRTWGNEDLRMDMDEAGTGISRFAKLAKAKDGRTALAWEDDRSGQEQIYLRVRSAGERGEWGPEVRVTTPTPKHATRLPELLWAPDGVLHLAWQVWNMAMAPTRIPKQIDGRTLKPDSPQK